MKLDHWQLQEMRRLADLFSTCELDQRLAALRSGMGDLLDDLEELRGRYHDAVSLLLQATDGGNITVGDLTATDLVAIDEMATVCGL